MNKYVSLFKDEQGNVDAVTATTFLTADMLKPITDAITSNLQVLLPVGVGIMGTIIAVGLIPRIIYKFL